MEGRWDWRVQMPGLVKLLLLSAPAPFSPNPHQAGIGPHSSTKMSLSEITNDMLVASSCGYFSVLILQTCQQYLIHVVSPPSQ